MATAIIHNVSAGFFLISSLLNVTVFCVGSAASLPEKFCSNTVSPDCCTYCFFTEDPGGGADNTSTPTDLGNLAIGCMMKETGVFQKHLNSYTTDHNLKLRQRAIMCVSLMSTVLEDLIATGWSFGLRRFREVIHSAQMAKLDLQHCTDLFDSCIENQGLCC